MRLSGSCVLVLLLAVVAVAGLMRCRRDRCVDLSECPALEGRLRSPVLDVRSSVRSAICEFTVRSAKVCCPVDDVEYTSSVLNTLANEIIPGRRMKSPRGEGRTIPEITPKPESRNGDLLPDSCGRPRARIRIHSGTDTTVGAYPWIAAIRYRMSGGPETVHCAGSLINSRYVVTAAHCIGLAARKGWQISSLALGDWRLSTDPDCIGGSCASKAVVVQVEEAIEHPKYGRRSLFDHDIALLRLDRPVSFSWGVQPICLPPRTLAPGEVSIGRTVRGIGWGMTETATSSDVLQETTLPIANPFSCERLFPSHFHLNGVQMCVGGNFSDTCKGDSGGPIMMVNSDGNYYLLGITSFGYENCGMQGTPAVYTSVPHFLDWIRSSIRP